MIKKIGVLLAAATMTVAGAAVSVGLAGNGYSHTISTITTVLTTGTTGGGHTPVTICHKPGTPAEMTLVVDDDAVPGHLGHGDYLGECQTVTTTTVTTGTTPTGTTPTTTTPGHDCTFVGADKDGGHDANGGTNDDCAPFPPTTTTAAPPAVVVPPAVAATPPPAVTVVPPKVKPAAKPKPPVKATPKPKPVAKPKPKPKKQPKLTGNPKVDKCKDLGYGTMKCKGIVVQQGQG